MITEFNASKMGALVIVMMVIVGTIGLRILAQMPDVVRVQPQSHATIKHGVDALTTRLAVYNCDPSYFQIFVSDGVNPRSVGKWLFVCPDSAHHRCAGMITPTVFEDGAYGETTAYLASCKYWLVRVPPRDGFIPAPVVVVRRAMEMILAMEVYDADNSN